MKAFVSTFFFLQLFTIAAPFAIADQPNTNPLVASVRLQPSNVSPGQTADLLISMQLTPGFHAYADKFKIAVESPDDLKVGDLKLTPVVQFFDSVTKKMRDGVEGDSKAQAVLEIPNGMKPGSYSAKIKLTYQACAKDYCLFPKTLTLDAPMTVTAAGTALTTAAPTSTPPALGSGNSFEQAMDHSLALAILVVFGMGLVTSLTPCIYPMIPITLAILGARTKDQTKLKSFSLSVTYVLGIAFTYSILGVAAAKTGALFGAALGNIYVVTAIALLFVTMALSMYGLFEIQVPAFLRNSLGTKQTNSGYIGAFITGLIAGVVASPCVGPVLVSVLTYIAQTQNTFLGFVLLFSFAMGLGVLFIVLGTFSSLLGKMPKAGAWMELTKFLFGSVMIAMALYYIAPIYPAWLFHLLTGLSLVAIASSYGAFEPMATLSKPVSKLRKGLMLAAFFAGLLFVGMGALEKAAPAIPLAASGLKVETHKLSWQPYSDNALKGALESGKPVLIDFYADWCGACKEMERDTFPDQRIQDLSQKFALLQIDATDDSELLDRLRKTYAVRGLPTMIFYDSKGKLRSDLTVTGFEDASTFLKQMQSAQNAN